MWDKRTPWFTGSHWTGHKEDGNETFKAKPLTLDFPPFLMLFLVISSLNLLQNSCKWRQRLVYPQSNMISPEVISARRSSCSEAGSEDAWCVQTGRFFLCRPAFLPLLSAVVRVVNNVCLRGLRWDCLRSWPVHATSRPWMGLCQGIVCVHVWGFVQSQWAWSSPLLQRDLKSFPVF